jgi:TonB-linked SusC/RagA family outer membrane protein
MQNHLQNACRPRSWRQLLLWGLLLLPGLVAAQGRTVRGTITAATDNSPLPGVSVIVKGSTVGTTADGGGNYTINLPAGGETLVYSFIGFASQEVEAGNREVIDIRLAEDVESLSEVVVTALGIPKDKKTLGYAIQEVKGQDLIKAREPNPINALAGKVAGLTVGASPELLRRPQVALRGNTDLLYVVDGVPINSDTWNLSPDDIETYTVLKGPAASALYGFRGKNGAILITTKRGTRDPRGFSVEVNSSTMLDRGFLAIPEVQDEYGPGDHGAYEFVDGRGGGKNDGDYDIWGPPLDGRLLPQYDSPVDPVTGVRTPTPWLPRGKNNLRRYLETGVLTTHNAAVSSGNEKYDLRFSTSYAHQKGIVPNTKLNIVNFNVTTGYNFSDRLRFESNLNYNRQFTPNYPDVNYGPNSMIYNMVTWGGADWNVDDMRNYWQPGKEGIQQIYAEYQRYNNPYFMAYEWLRGHRKTDLYGYASMRYKFTDYLEVSGRTQVTTWDLFRNEKLPVSMGTYGRDERLGDYREDRRNLFENNTDVLLKFDRNVTPDLNVKAWAGGNLRTWNFNSTFTTTDYLNVPGLYTFANSRNPIKAYNYDARMQVLSGYYSLDLSFRDYVNVSTTGRVDKLSTLPQQNNTYFYPSVAVSTAISDYVNLPAAVSFLKVRGSYANVKDALTRSTIGATPTGGYPLNYGDNYASAYDGPTYQNAAVYNTPLVYNNLPGAQFTNTLNNPDLKPNTTAQFETGLDVRFLQNRLAFDATYFVSNEGPRIFSLPLSETTGYTAALVNGIKTQKRGVELSLTGTVLRNPSGLNWEVLANWSTYRETLSEIYPGVDRLNTYEDRLAFLRVGDRTDKAYGRAFIRTPDGQLINDAGGRPIYNPVAQFLGYTNPDWVWGLNNRFGWKSLTFSFQFDGRVGGVIKDYIQQQTFRGGRHIATVQGAMGEARRNDVEGIKSWTGDGVVVSNGAAIRYDNDGNITNYGELEFAPNTTATFLQDYISRYYNSDEGNLISRSFMKLREVVIGYALPQSLLGKSFIRQASVSVVGRNLLYFAEKKDLDIEQYVNPGETGSTLQTPTTRRFGFNVNLVF